MSADVDPALAEKAVAIHERLCAVYGCPIDYFQHLDPLSELVSTLLNHRTRNRQAKAAFEALREAFPSWEAVRDAPTPEVQDAIHGVNWPEQKAPRVQSVLRAITEERGELSLKFLADMPVRDARRWLERIPGIGPKTSAAVLSFSTLRKAALPVDSHHHRVAQRVGLIPRNMDVGPAHAALEALMPPEWDAQEVYDHHQVFMRLGQKTCHWRGPECGRCPILDLCPTGRATRVPPPRQADPRQGELRL
ncbi:endonuclease-3 [Hasllibacter halocynthiae]|uniref:Endonuclease-3 n=1 Tax=Hasllibacter halocynthiae TaxID=595589 RepID=A0A2T0X8I2_9RHOB|nr:Fe-S cluster assembly protein HesB [Hasllibacter halocynthiae]PRY95258.1 endonuclease-3 [Hasllibacter halocynthiae]